MMTLALLVICGITHRVLFTATVLGLLLQFLCARMGIVTGIQYLD